MKVDLIGLWGCAKGSPWAEGLRRQGKEPPELPWTGEELVERGVSGLVFSPPCSVGHLDREGHLIMTAASWDDPVVPGLSRYPHAFQDGSEVQIIDRVASYRDRLDVAGWFGADDAQRKDQAALAAGYRLIHELDPQHRPVVLDFAPPYERSEILLPAILTCDVPGVHVYPVGLYGAYLTEVHHVVSRVRNYWQQGPLWFYVQLCSWREMPKPGEPRGSEQQPTAQEIVEMVRYAVAAGATGIVGFGGWKRPADSEQWAGWWEAVRRL